MNMILPDFKRPACFGTYVVCYFSGICSERDVPDLFNITSRYPLMDRFEEVYFRIRTWRCLNRPDAPCQRAHRGQLPAEP